MRRTVYGVIAGLLISALGFWIATAAFANDPRVARGVALGGVVGTIVSSVGGGAQVALLRRNPKSNASFVAFGASFFAKLMFLVVGILLLGTVELGLNPAAFGVAFVAASIVATGFVLSALVQIQ
ncbi:MAG: hypothetical protein HY286_02775 [Planctomycetes bacterium]|nr:hypothetical protein [Planctomycetota bacterium]